MRATWSFVLWLVTIGMLATGCGLLNGAVRAGSATQAVSDRHEVTTLPQTTRTTVIEAAPADPARPGVTVTMTEKPVAAGTTETTERSASASSAPIEAPAADAQNLVFKPPKLELTSAGPIVSGGSVTWSKEATKSLLGGGGIIYVLGGIAVIAGVIVIGVLKQWVIGGWVSGAGVVVLILAYGLSTYPWLVFVFVGLAVAGAIWFLFHTHATVQQAATLEAHDVTLGTIVKGVEAAPKEAAAAVKDSIEKTSTDADFPTVKRVVSEFKLGG